MQERSIAASELISELARRRWLLVLGGVVGVLVALLVIFLSPRKYVVEAVVGPAESGMNVSAIGGVYGQLARLGGLGGGGGANFESAMTLLKTRGLCVELASKLKLREELFPGEQSGGLKEAILGPAPPVTDDDACEFLWSNIISVDINKLSGFATVRATWMNSEDGARWVNSMLKLTNDRLRQAAVRDTQGSLRVLHGMLEAEQSVEMRQVLVALVQQQMSRLATTQGATSFALSVLDPAQAKAPQDYSWPKKKLILAVGFAGGFLLAAGLALLLVLRDRWSREQTD